MLPEIDAYLVRRSAMERAYSLTAIPVEYAFASTRAGTLRSRVPRGTRDARRRAIGEATAAARVRPTRALRATARIPQLPGFQLAGSPPAPRAASPRDRPDFR